MPGLAAHTLHSTPHTLHITPFTLHPAPHSLHPTPYAPLGTASRPAVSLSMNGMKVHAGRKAILEVINREFFSSNLLVQIQLIIEMIWWTGLAPWDFAFPFPGSRISTFLVLVRSFACPG